MRDICPLRMYSREKERKREAERKAEREREREREREERKTERERQREVREGGRENYLGSALLLGLGLKTPHLLLVGVGVGLGLVSGLRRLVWLREKLLVDVVGQNTNTDDSNESLRVWCL